MHGHAFNELLYNLVISKMFIKQLIYSVIGLTACCFTAYPQFFNTEVVIWEIFPELNETTAEAGYKAPQSKLYGTWYLSSGNGYIVINPNGTGTYHTLDDEYNGIRIVWSQNFLWKKENGLFRVKFVGEAKHTFADMDQDKYHSLNRYEKNNLMNYFRSLHIRTENRIVENRLCYLNDNEMVFKNDKEQVWLLNKNYINKLIMQSKQPNVTNKDKEPTAVRNLTVETTQAHTTNKQTEASNMSSRNIDGNSDQKVFTPVESVPVKEPHNKMLGVDLGLPSGRIWATCNLGAESPYEFGAYYCRGSIYPGLIIDNSLRFDKGIGYDKLPYAKLKQIGVLRGNPKYDAAAHQTNGKWRVPDEQDFAELMEHCVWQFTVRGGVNGYLITRNGNSIFLPLGGRIKREWKKKNYSSEFGFQPVDIDQNVIGAYWYYDNKLAKADVAGFEWNAMNPQSYTHISDYSTYNMDAISIRPVSDYSLDELGINLEDVDIERENGIFMPPSEPSGEVDGREFVDLGLPSGKKWARYNIGSESLYQSKQYKWDEFDMEDELGENWILPTRKDFEELRDNCLWTLISDKSMVDEYKHIIPYFICTGPNKNSIIFPYSSSLSYWTSESVDTNEAYSFDRTRWSGYPTFHIVKEPKTRKNYVRPLLRNSCD